MNQKEDLNLFLKEMIGATEDDYLAKDRKEKKMKKVIEDFERRTSSHPWWKSRKRLAGKFSITKGGVIHHNCFSEIENFLTKFGHTKPEVKISGGLLYRHIKEWRVQIFALGKAFEVPFSYQKQDSVEGNDEWEGLRIVDFLAFEKIKPEEIKSIQLIISR